MKSKLTDRVVEFLRQTPDTLFTARQIADWVVANYLDEYNAKVRKSKSIGDDDLELLARRLVDEITGQRFRLYRKGIKTSEGRPRRYYFTELTYSEEVARAEGRV